MKVERDRSEELHLTFRCFNNYMHLKSYWIIDGPRYAVMIVRGRNFLLDLTSHERTWIRLDQRHFPPEHYSSSPDENERRIGKSNSRRVTFHSFSFPRRVVVVRCENAFLSSRRSSRSHTFFSRVKVLIYG